jgi:hypothetical protein
MIDLARGHAELGRERRWTYDAARGIHQLEPTALVTLAESRAGAGPVQSIDIRDFVQEAREELADARNYLVWLRHQLDRGAHLNLELVDVLRRDVRAALADTALTFERVEQIRALMTDWRHAIDLAA